MPISASDPLSLKYIPLLYSQCQVVASFRIYLNNSYLAHSPMPHSLTVFLAFLPKSLSSCFFITLHGPPKQWDLFQPDLPQVLLLNRRSAPLPASFCGAPGEQSCRASCEPSYENLGDVGFWMPIIYREEINRTSWKSPGLPFFLHPTFGRLRGLWQEPRCRWLA